MVSGSFFHVFATTGCGTVLSTDGRQVAPHYKRLNQIPMGERSRRLRPYHVENTGSRPITEVKQRRAWLVRGWVTASEYHVL